MKAWTSRANEEAYLLNPAFCCLALVASILEYRESKKEGMPFPLLFMVLPMVLHQPTRRLLPQNIRTSMPAWLQSNASAQVLFHSRVVSLRPHTREALQFGLLHQWIVKPANGLLDSTRRADDIERAIRALKDEASECVTRARFVGRWFASSGEPSTVMALWGIKP